jgi:uncharacterized protein YdaU (DUF1376 family)
MANELHTMPIKIEALLSSRRVQALKMDEFGAYIRLLCLAWLEGATLPSNEIRDSLPMVSDDDWPRIKEHVIDRFFIKSEDGKMYNERQVEVYSETMLRSDKARNASRKANASRWQSGRSPVGVRSESGRSPVGVRSESESDPIQSQSQNQSISPLPPSGGTYESMSTSLESDTISAGACACVCEEEQKKIKTNWAEKVTWDEAAGDYSHVDDGIINDWRQTYPACNINAEINKAAHWLRANPSKGKKNHYRFLTNWLSRTQEKGGSR